MINVVVTDDHRMFTDALAVFFTPESGIHLNGSATNGDELMLLLKQKQPDVILLDINMPGMNGITATSLIRKKYPQVKIIIITMYRNREFIISLYKLGVDGYLLKNSSKEELIGAIKTVYSGGTCFSDEINQTVMQENKYDRPDHFDDTKLTLSKRETEIVRLLANGLSSQEVADTLFLSYYTIETHRKNLLNKLNLHNTAELVKYAAQLGLLD
ncbi:MAG: response regulator transcription factor [Bacteroidota bacterium]